MAQLPTSATMAQIIAQLRASEGINEQASLGQTIGAPTLSTDAVASQIAALQTQKNNLAANLAAFGLSATGSDSLKSLVDKVPSTTPAGSADTWTVDTGETVAFNDLIEILTTGTCRKSRNYNRVKSISAATVIKASSLTYFGEPYVLKLDSNRALVLFYDHSASDYTYAVVVSGFDSGIITVGATVALNASSANVTNKFLSLTLVDSTHALATYYEVANGPRAVMLTIDATTNITVGTPINLTGFSSTSVQGCLLDSTHVFLAHVRSSDNFAGGVVVTISGTTLTLGTGIAIDSSRAPHASTAMRCHAIDSTHVLVFWYYSAGTQVVGTVATISGATVTANTSYVLSANASTSGIALIKLSGGRFVIYYASTIRLGSVAGTVITYGSFLSSVPGSNTRAHAVALDDDLCTLFPTSGSLNMFTVAGTTTIYLADALSEYSNSYGAEILAMTASKLALFRFDTGVPYATVALVSPRLSANGVAKQNGTAGQNINVQSFA